LAKTALKVCAKNERLVVTVVTIQTETGNIVLGKKESRTPIAVT
jgi:hypothetical protein